MPHPFEAHTDLEAVLLEQALLMERELRATADAVSDGQVLALAKRVALRAGRELPWRALEAARRVATRYEKLATHCLAVVKLAIIFRLLSLEPPDTPRGRQT
jgi:hypothetical protein